MPSRIKEERRNQGIKSKDTNDTKTMMPSQNNQRHHYGLFRFAHGKSFSVYKGMATKTGWGLSVQSRVWGRICGFVNPP
jgi:hypothetical protein